MRQDLIDQPTLLSLVQMTGNPLPDSADRTSILTRFDALRIAAIVIPCALIVAHFNQGADAASTTIGFVIGFCALFAALLAVARFETVNLGMTLIAILFLIWFQLGLFGNWHQAQYEVQALVAGGAVLGCGFLIGRKPGGLKTAWAALIWTLIVFAAIAALAYFSNVSDLGHYGSRLFAGFGSANTAATLFGLAMLLSVGKLMARFQDSRFTNRTGLERLRFWVQHDYASFILLILASACLLFTVSRMGILVSLVSVFGLVIFESLRMTRRGRLMVLRQRRVAIPVSLGIVIVLFLALSGEINPNHQESLLQNADGRAEAYSIYWNTWMEKPWFGHGLGSFNAVNDQITTLENAGALMPLGAAHNVYLQWLLQQGLIGVLAMGFVFAVIFTPMLRAIRSQSRKPRNFIRLALAMTYLVFAHGLVDYALEIPSIMWTYAFILGLAAGYAERACGSSVGEAE